VKYDLSRSLVAIPSMNTVVRKCTTSCESFDFDEANAWR
jgi:hypothetical protein